MADKSMPHNMGPIALALIIAALLFSGAYYYSPSKSTTTVATQQQAFQPHMLSVSSDASREVAPDKVEIIFGVVSIGMDPSTIQADNDAKLSQIKSTLIALGVPEANIKTVGYSLDRYQEYNKTTETYDYKGYRLSNSLRAVSYDVSLAGKIVKSAVANGANDVSGITFSLSDASQKKIYGELLQSAASSAKEKAQAIAAASGVQIVSLYSMNEGYNFVAPLANAQYNFKDMAAGAESAPEVSISAGLVKVTANVAASYEIAG